MANHIRPLRLLALLCLCVALLSCERQGAPVEHPQPQSDCSPKRLFLPTVRKPTYPLWACLRTGTSSQHQLTLLRETGELFGRGGTPVDDTDQGQFQTRPKLFHAGGDQLSYELYIFANQHQSLPAKDLERYCLGPKPNIRIEECGANHPWCDFAYRFQAEAQQDQWLQQQCQLLSTSSWGQTATSVAEGTSGGIVPTDATLDREDNTIVTGYVRGRAVFPPQAPIGAPQSPSRLFLAKWDTSGVLKWVKLATGKSAGQALDVTDNGDIVLAGSFSEPLQWDLLKPDGTQSQGAFLLKLSPEGIPRPGWPKWLKDGNIEGLVVDQDENIVITGNFQGTWQLETATLTTQNTGLYVAKYKGDGGFLWAQQADSAKSHHVRAIATHKGNIFITGDFSGPIIFGRDSLTLSVPSIQTEKNLKDLFVAHLAPDGTWRKTIPVSGKEAATENARAIAIDTVGNIGLIADLQESALGSQSNASRELYIALFQPNLTLKWEQYGRGSQEDTGQDLTFDKEGHLHFIASIRGTFSIPTETGSFDTNSPRQDIILGVLNKETGLAIWVEQFGEKDHSEVPMHLSRNQNEFLLVGTHEVTFSINELTFPSTSTQNTPSSSIFLRKYSTLP